MAPFSAFSVIQQRNSQRIIGDGNPKLRDTPHPLPPTFTTPLYVSRQKSFNHRLKFSFFLMLRSACFSVLFSLPAHFS